MNNYLNAYIHLCKNYYHIYTYIHIYANIYIYIYIYIYVYISGHKSSTAHRVLQFHGSKIGVI